jgi:hypothetical protein
MATEIPSSMPMDGFNDKKQVDEEAVPADIEESGQGQREILGVLDFDPALNGKMHLVNNVCISCLILLANRRCLGPPESRTYLWTPVPCFESC